MTSCAEATFFLRNCPGVKMDGITTVFHASGSGAISRPVAVSCSRKVLLPRARGVRLAPRVNGGWPIDLSPLIQAERFFGRGSGGARRMNSAPG